MTLDPFVRWAAKPARLTVESNTTHDLAVGSVFLCRKRTRQPASRIRPLSPEKDARVPASSPWMFTARQVVRLRGHQGRPSADGSPQPLSKTSLPIQTECRVARFGPTTPKQFSWLRSITPKRARMPAMLPLWEAPS